jgi:hypothetical protein
MILKQMIFTIIPGKPLKESEFVVVILPKNRCLRKLIGKDLKLATWKKYNYACIQIVGLAIQI